MFEPLGFLMHLIPGDPQHVGEKALDQAVAADDCLGVLAALRREVERLVRGAADVAVAFEPADHLAHGRGRELHRAGHIGGRHRQLRLL